jgi:hypothetical protein
VKKQISPAVVIVAIACVVVAIAVGAWRAATSTPNYPGAGAGKPTGMAPGASVGGEVSADVKQNPQGRIPGAGIATPGGGGAPAGGNPPPGPQ